MATPDQTVAVPLWNLAGEAASDLEGTAVLESHEVGEERILRRFEEAGQGDSWEVASSLLAY